MWFRQVNLIRFGVHQQIKSHEVVPSTLLFECKQPNKFLIHSTKIYHVNKNNSLSKENYIGNICADFLKPMPSEFSILSWDWEIVRLKGWYLSGVLLFPKALEVSQKSRLFSGIMGFLLSAANALFQWNFVDSRGRGKNGKNYVKTSTLNLCQNWVWRL